MKIFIDICIYKKLVQTQKVTALSAKGRAKQMIPSNKEKNLYPDLGL